MLIILFIFEIEFKLKAFFLIFVNLCKFYVFLFYLFLPIVKQF